MKPHKIHIPILSESEQDLQTIRCTHERSWPPPLVRLGVDAEAMWRNGEISQHDFQQIDTWKRACGLLEMAEKCITCPLAKVEKVRGGSGRIETFNLMDTIKQAKADATKAEYERRTKMPQVHQTTPVAPPPTETSEPEPMTFSEELGGVAEPDYPITEDAGTGDVINFDDAQQDEDELIDALLSEDE